MADRRSRVRFEIVGRLRGTVAADATLRVRNLCGGGALVEAPWPLPLAAPCVVRLDAGAQVATLDAHVRHVRRDAAESTYLIGLEFAAAEQPAAETFARLLLDQRAEPTA